MLQVKFDSSPSFFSFKKFKNNFAFQIETDDNLIFLKGKNGTGKTSFLELLNWPFCPNKNLLLKQKKWSLEAKWLVNIFTHDGLKEELQIEIRKTKPGLQEFYINQKKYSYLYYKRFFEKYDPFLLSAWPFLTIIGSFFALSPDNRQNFLFEVLTRSYLLKLDLAKNFDSLFAKNFPEDYSLKTSFFLKWKKHLNNSSFNFFQLKKDIQQKLKSLDVDLPPLNFGPLNKYLQKYELKALSKTHPYYSLVSELAAWISKTQESIQKQKEPLLQDLKLLESLIIYCQNSFNKILKEELVLFLNEKEIEVDLSSSDLVFYKKIGFSDLNDAQKIIVSFCLVLAFQKILLWDLPIFFDGGQNLDSAHLSKLKNFKKQIFVSLVKD